MSASEIPTSDTSTHLNQISDITDTFRPVKIGERISSIDVLRGFALFGILVIKIDLYAMVDVIFLDPSAMGGFTGVNLFIFRMNNLLFLGKMLAVFSMLFGAGAILMTSRAEAKGVRFGRIYYRRLFWLFIFGMLHAYFLWCGDILVSYALCGLLLYPMRRILLKWLITFGAVLLLVSIVVLTGMGYGLELMKKTAETAQAKIDAGETPDQFGTAIIKAWTETSKTYSATGEYAQEQLNAYRGGFRDVMAKRALQSLTYQTFTFFLAVLWPLLGLMIIGMALMKLRVFSAERSFLWYVACAVIFYAIGLTGTYYSMTQDHASNYDFIEMYKNSYITSSTSVLVALGHVCLLMFLCKLGLLTRLKSALAAVGRMAFTDYLRQSIICTTLFYGYGFGLYAELERYQLFLIVVAICIFQLLTSSWWLSRYQMGPFEWLWRSLTYRKCQPMRSMAMAL